ncbi:hypothetical protein [Massilibacterium senegalense]|uniref:hypothetical protein n=1 Tax=Massilibacterium senegalense TaxID=1632858 RepID=UPI0011C784F4|nr:hypothetical protein [Massilibacterium senegalense]
MNSSDIPRPESVAFFEKAIRQHNKVIDFKKINEYYYSVELNNGCHYKIYLTNIYTVSLADVMEFSISYDIDAIVTISSWNGYTLEAKEYSQSIGKGLFLFSELMGALNFEKPEEYFSGYHDEKNITMEFDEISIYQFGSSLNIQTPNDIDLLIVYRNRSYKEILKLIKLRRTLRIQLQKILGIPIDIVLLSNKEERQLLYLDQINYKKIL